MSAAQGMFDRLTRLTAAIRARGPAGFAPRVAILLGTGLGGLANRIVADATIPYDDLPDMPQATAESHAGEVILGHLDGRPVVAWSGRLHAYEGHPPADLVVPVRLSAMLGAGILVMGSAVGGLQPRHAVGDLVIIDDHINLMGINPLVGPNDDRIGPRWPDMVAPYCPRLIDAAVAAAAELKQPLHRAIYAAVLGPNLETRAEYRMLRNLGADVVGMSTVPEAIAAVHGGLRTLALAVVTDRCLADALEPADIGRIIAAAQGAAPKLAALITATLARADA